MAIYLSAPVVRASVKRLRGSSARPTLCDYLIFRRALKLSDPSQVSVITGLGSHAYTEAVVELTKCGDEVGREAKYFNPFGTAREDTMGFRSYKYPSNGPSDTASRWQSRSNPPMMLVPNTTPKEFRFADSTAQHLEEFFIASGAGAEKPQVLDAAIWRFREANLEDRFGSVPGEEQLVAAFIEDLGLEHHETSALFGYALSATAAAATDSSS